MGPGETLSCVIWAADVLSHGEDSRSGIALFSPAVHSLMLSVCSLKRIASEGRKRGGSKVKEASRKILKRLEHVKLCNMHLQIKRGRGQILSPFKSNHFKSDVYN